MFVEHEAYRIRPARYTKGKIAITPLDSKDGFKRRASYLLCALNGRWTNREKAYIVSPTKARKFIELYRDGWDATTFGELLPPGEMSSEQLLVRTAVAQIRKETAVSYPEHERLKKIHDESQTCGAFLEWLQEQGVTLARWEKVHGFKHPQLVPTRQSITELLAQYFNIDLNKLEDEKRQMLKELRKS